MNTSESRPAHSGPVASQSQTMSHADRIKVAADADRLRNLWCEARDRAKHANAGSNAFARVADLAAAFAAMAIRAGQPAQARTVVGDALATLRASCVRDPSDLARHLAFARTLELAAAHEVSARDAHAAFDALRAAIATVGPFAPSLSDRTTDPLTRLALSAALLRPITTAARMVDDRKQRRLAFKQVWNEARAWAKAAKGATDHPAAIEMAVLAAFDLAVEERGESSSGCLERCEILRGHIDVLQRVRGLDAVVCTHRAALARLSADAWRQLGDAAEAKLHLDKAAAHLDAAAGLEGREVREIAAQRRALAIQRSELILAAT